MLLSLSFFVLLSLSINAQNDSTFVNPSDKNSINIELGGIGGVYSFYYERLFGSKKRLKTALSIGGNYIPLSTSSYYHFGIPIGIQEVISFKYFDFFTGIGMNIYSENVFETDTIQHIDTRNFESKRIGSEIRTFYSLPTGFKLQSKRYPIVGKIAYSPLLTVRNGKLNYLHWTGLSLGFTF